MTIPAKSMSKKAELTGRIAGLLLTDGMALVPLRDLAGRLGTSDRMLLYYFSSQADLTAAALAHLSGLLAARLERVVPPVRLPAGALLKKLAIVMARSDIAPILRVWADVSARGARGEAPFMQFAQGAATQWRDWIAARLDLPKAARRDNAAAILVAIEGARMLELSAPGAAKGAIATLAKAFEA